MSFVVAMPLVGDISAELIARTLDGNGVAVVSSREVEHGKNRIGVLAYDTEDVVSVDELVGYFGDLVDNGYASAVVGWVPGNSAIVIGMLDDRADAAAREVDMVDAVAKRREEQAAHNNVA